MMHLYGPSDKVLHLRNCNFIPPEDHPIAGVPTYGSASWGDLWPRSTIEDAVPKGVIALLLAVHMENRVDSATGNTANSIRLRPNGSSFDNGVAQAVAHVRVKDAAGGQDMKGSDWVIVECDADGIVEGILGYAPNTSTRALVRIAGYWLKNGLWGPPSVVHHVPVINFIRQKQIAPDTAWALNAGTATSWTDAWSRADVEDLLPYGVRGLIVMCRLESRHDGTTAKPGRIFVRRNGSTVSSGTTRMQVAGVGWSGLASGEMHHDTTFFWAACDADGIIEYELERSNMMTWMVPVGYWL